MNNGIIDKPKKERKPRTGRFSDPKKLERLRAMVGEGVPYTEIAAAFQIKDANYIYTLVKKHSIWRPEKVRSKNERGKPEHQEEWEKQGLSMKPDNYHIEMRDGIAVKICKPGFAIGVSPQQNFRPTPSDSVSAWD